MQPDPMQFEMMGSGGAMMIVMILLWVLLLGVVAWLVYRALRGLSGRGGSSGEESAEEVLKRRYARGEIDRETYRRMRNDLAQGPPTS